MEYKQIQELIKMINKSSISELSIKDGEFEITIKQETNTIISPAQVYAAPIAAPAAPPVVAPPAQSVTATEAPKAEEKSQALSDNLHTVKSPMIGTFYRSSAPDKPPFVNVGDEIKPGQAICIVEAMKLFNEIESEISGKIVKVLVDDASPIEYDQPLFLVELS